MNWLFDKIRGLSIKTPMGRVGVPGVPDSIPRLAEGGTVTRPGRVLVGEQGPEFLDLPRGARVTPLDKSGGEVVIHNVLELDGRVIFENFRRRLADQAELA